MARSSSLVAGPSALHFFDRRTVRDLHVLHVYVSGFRNTVDLCTYLMTQGYSFRPCNFHAKHLDPFTGFVNLDTLRRAYVLPSKDGVIDAFPDAIFDMAGTSDTSFTRHLSFTFVAEVGENCIRVVSGIASAVREILRADSSTHLLSFVYDRLFSSLFQPLPWIFSAITLLIRSFRVRHSREGLRWISVPIILRSTDYICTPSTFSLLEVGISSPTYRRSLMSVWIPDAIPWGQTSGYDRDEWGIASRGLSDSTMHSMSCRSLFPIMVQRLTSHWTRISIQRFLMDSPYRTTMTSRSLKSIVICYGYDPSLIAPGRQMSRKRTTAYLINSHPNWTGGCGM